MIISNLLLIPGTGDTASEIFHALRYEKTVRLYAVNLGVGSEEHPPTPHRMTPLRQLPGLHEASFLDALKEILTHTSIHYIVPTTAEAREFFKQHSDVAAILDTQSTGSLPHTTEETSFVLDCCSDKEHVPIYIGARQKGLTSDGKHVLWETALLTDKQSRAVANTAKKYRLTGAWSMAINTDGQLMAVTPFFTPVMGIYRALGVNFMLLMLHTSRDNPVSALPIKGQSKRLNSKQAVSLNLDYKTVFLDMDDTLISHGSINDSISTFIYYCRANGIPIHLITRHYRNPVITLCEFGIAEDLFSSIIWIEDDTPKSSFMLEADMPLFIDDAFSERRAVSTAIDIPCLPPEAVEALMTNL
ncbi:MAG: hypothetical protein AB3N28_13925 [Kordiimonas sp.]